MKPRGTLITELIVLVELEGIFTERLLLNVCEQLGGGIKDDEANKGIVRKINNNNLLTLSAKSVKDLFNLQCGFWYYINSRL